jgi:hypothetical protein
MRWAKYRPMLDIDGEIAYPMHNQRGHSIVGNTYRHRSQGSGDRWPAQHPDWRLLVPTAHGSRSTGSIGPYVSYRTSQTTDDASCAINPLYGSAAGGTFASANIARSWRDPGKSHRRRNFDTDLEVGDVLTVDPMTDLL